MQSIFAAFLAFIIAWECFKLSVIWRQGATNLAGRRYSRNDAPTAFWVLLLLHVVFVIATATWLLAIIAGRFL